MMICPKTFLNEFLVGKSTTKIKKEINKLKRHIRDLKRILENPVQDNPLLFIDPSPLVQIKCNYDYLMEAILYLKELGEEYIPTKAEQKAFEFSKNVNNVEKITFCICGCFELRQPIEITFDKERVIRTEQLVEGPILSEMEDYDKESFLEDFNSLMIGTWRRSYSPERFGIESWDGESWDLTIEYDNGFKTQKFVGSNAYPYNFDELCQLLQFEKTAEE